MLKFIKNLGFLTLIFTSASGFARSSNANGECSTDVALTKAREVVAVIAKVNGIDDTATAGVSKLSFDEDYYYVETSYDLGLSVPTYTAKLTRSSCFLTDVIFSNYEG